VRQPLAELVVDVRNDADRARLPRIADQLKDELNVKAVRDAREVGGLIEFSVRPNLKLLGPKYGTRLQAIRRLLVERNAAEIALAQEQGRHILLDEFTLLPDEVLVDQRPIAGYVANSEEGLVAALKTELTPELITEGIAREVVHLVQNLRKDADLEIADRIRLFVDGPEAVVEALRANEGYVRDEVLATIVAFGEVPSAANKASFEVDGHLITAGVIKA